MLKSKKIFWTEGYKYRLNQDFTILVEMYPKEDITSSTGLITLTKDGWLTIWKNYSWDGASGLTFDTKSSIRGALTHDALYELMREGLFDIKWRRRTGSFGGSAVKMICGPGGPMPGMTS